MHSYVDVYKYSCCSNESKLLKYCGVKSLVLRSKQSHFLFLSLSHFFMSNHWARAFNFDYEDFNMTDEMVILERNWKDLCSRVQFDFFV